MLQGAYERLHQRWLHPHPAWTIFALPGDSLAAAAGQGRLHRNFQGYTTGR